MKETAADERATVNVRSIHFLITNKHLSNERGTRFNIDYRFTLTFATNGRAAAILPVPIGAEVAPDLCRLDGKSPHR